ncbi:hypothetical protein BI344_03720 [Chromobacterium sphagni]|uniref:Uncharacterized protein n=2 Tax=Chromobacterium sphagni TaxID=1903179 RepID=A0ABX3CHP3_9NEIS|nr:hypothetical protein BI344_03720 [Chromobacterium sphagni]
MPGKEQGSAWETSKDAAEQLGKLPENVKKAGDSMVNMARKADAADHQLRQLANLAFPERDMSGRKQGMAQLDKIVVAAGGGRDDAAAALTTLLQNGVKLNDAEKLLPQLVNGGQALGVSAQKLAEAAVGQGEDKKDAKDQAKSPPDADKINQNLRFALAEAAAKPADYHPDEADKWLPDLLKKVGKNGVSQENLTRYDNNVQMMRESAQFKDQSQQSALANSEQNKRASQILGDQKANYSEIVSPLLDCAAALLTFGSALAGVVAIVGKIAKGADGSTPSLPSKPGGKQGKNASGNRSSKSKTAPQKSGSASKKLQGPQATPSSSRSSGPTRAGASEKSTGIFSQLATKTKGMLQKTAQSGTGLPAKLRSMAGSGGHSLRQSGGILGGFLKGGLRIAGKASGIVGLATGAIGAYQVLSNPNSTVGNKIRAVGGQLGGFGGSAIGGVVGGAIGMLGGPAGAALGAMAGRAVGGWLGETLGDKAGAMLGNKIDHRQAPGTPASSPAASAQKAGTRPSIPAGANAPATARPGAPQTTAAKPPQPQPKGKGDSAAASLLPQLQVLVNQFAAAVAQLHQPLRVVVDVQHGNIVAAVNAANSQQQRRS